MPAVPTYAAPQAQLGGQPPRHTSPPQANASQTSTLGRNSAVQLYAPGSTNVSPTSTYQQPNPATAQLSSGGNPTGTGPLNPFWVHFAPPRQLQQPKSPLYRPAVLRTTERPSRPSTANGSTTGTQSPSQVAMNTESKDGSSGLGIFSGSEIFSNVFGTTTLGVVPEWDESLNKPVTGPPNRDHWKEDSLSTTCDLTICAKNFTLFERRHHCRRCGQIFCAGHTSHYVRLDQDCEFHPQGTLSRTCDCCFDEYKRLVAQRRASSASTNTSNSSGGSTVPSSPIVNKGNKGADAFGAKTAASYVGSVPRDWSWSTF